MSRPDPEPTARDPFADVVRGAIAQEIGLRDGVHPSEITARRWGEAAAMRINKAAVSAAGVADQGTSASAAQEYFPGVEETAIPLALNLRDQPLNARVVQPDANARGYWVAESAPGPLSLFSIMGDELPAKRAQALAVFTAESLTDPRVEARIVGDMRRASAGAINAAWFSDAAATDSTPAGIFHAVTPIASSGNLAADVAVLLEAFEGDLTQAALLCDPATAAQLAVLGFRGAKVAGRGEVAGLAQFASRDFARTSDGGFLAMVDQGGISRGFDGIEISRSKDATLNMTTDPGGENVPVSLFQNDLVAFRISARLNWRVARTSSVALVNGVSYGAGS